MQARGPTLPTTILLLPPSPSASSPCRPTKYHVLVDENKFGVVSRLLLGPLPPWAAAEGHFRQWASGWAQQISSCSSLFPSLPPALPRSFCSPGRLPVAGVQVCVQAGRCGWPPGRQLCLLAFLQVASSTPATITSLTSLAALHPVSPSFTCPSTTTHAPPLPGCATCSAAAPAPSAWCRPPSTPTWQPSGAACCAGEVRRWGGEGAGGLQGRKLLVAKQPVPTCQLGWTSGTLSTVLSALRLPATPPAPPPAPWPNLPHRRQRDGERVERRLRRDGVPACEP